ncbi:MAG: SLC13 family permease [Rhodospirillales bacterium]
MTQDQALIIAILAVTVGLFLWGKWRHDIIAVGALLACVIAGLVPVENAFSGFGHPAVVTVACVLVLSSGLLASGAVDLLTASVLPKQAGAFTTTVSLTLLAAVLSAFMNNVGALALLMPIAVRIARREELPPGKILMPLAFGSILGGMTTLIGTPPNLIVSGFRRQYESDGFGMFAFTPVGLAVALAGIAFIVLVGVKLVPTRKRVDADSFETAAYLTEARVPEGSKAKGKSLREIEAGFAESGAQVVALIRGGTRESAPGAYRRVRVDDILVIEAEPEKLSTALSTFGLELEEAVNDKKPESGTDEKPPKKTKDEEDDGKDGPSEEPVLQEAAVLPGSRIVGRSATTIGLRSRFGINLLAVSRSGSRSVARLRTMTIRAGDVLLLQGEPDSLAAFASEWNCTPLAERKVHLPARSNALSAGAIMTVAIVAAAFGLLPAAVAFATAVLACVVTRIVSVRTLYDAVDWPVVVLLAALIPVAGATADTGAADFIARLLLDSIAQGHAVVALALILIVTMTLSDFMNNAATAAVMCPIAIGAAERLAVNTDPFLMAVAVGASCAFLTPIGHQNNTLILGPGGFRFGDYWRLGLCIEVIVIAVGVPMLLLVWPL